MFTLVEYSKLTDNPRVSAIVEKFARTSVILELLPFKEVIGSAFTYGREERLPGIAFREVNAAYDESTGVINPQTEHMKIMGGDSDVDKALLKWEKNPGERRSTDVLQKAKAAALYFTKVFVDGDESSSGLEFDGLNQRLSGSQIIYGGDNGGDLSQNLLHRIIDAVKGTPDVILMGKKFRRQIDNLAESSTILSIDKDAFGRKVELFDGIRIGIVEEDNNDNTILDFDETRGNSSVTASCYPIRFGVDEFVCGVQTEPLEIIDLGYLQIKSAYRFRIEWLMTIAIFHARSAARLAGITAASGIA